MNNLARIVTKSNFSTNVIRRTIVGNQIVFNKEPGTTPLAPTSSSVNENVPGLSSACIKSESSKIIAGCSKTGDYKNPEYFCYDKNSYFEAEIEMLKYRCPQPSALNN